MLFNSFHYLLFFPLVVTLYFLIPQKAKNLWLLAASYYFYMSWNPKYALLMALSTFLTYLSGLLIGRENAILDRKQEDYHGKSLEVWRKKLWVFLCMLANLSILFFFKYFAFFLANVNRVLSAFDMMLVSPTFDVVLPVGISFYTFQALSYTMDVYRGEIYVEKNFVQYALFVSFFPQLVAGPIERSKNLLIQVNQIHKFDFERVRDGLIVVMWGLFLKLVVADRAAILVNTVYNNYQDYAGFELVLATVAFGIQIYCDFASYSIIAIGSAKVLGFCLMQNFKEPYFSRSITEFWRRWHISLSTWFRDYMYVPLGGNRKGNARKYLNIMIVFLTSGLWHGANWTFVIWGFLHGAFQVIGQMTKPWKERITDKLGIRRDRASYQLGQMIMTFGLVNFAWIFFRAPSLTAARGIITGIFSTWNPWIFTDGSLYLLGLTAKSFWAGIVAILVLAGVSAAEYRGIRVWDRFAEQGLVFRWIVSLALVFAVIIFGIYGPGYSASQFIYFQF